VPHEKTLFQKRATAEGSYWKSSASRHAVRHYLRGLATTTFKTAGDHMAWWEKDADLRTFFRGLDTDSFKKYASIGGEQEQGFEQAFSSLAYAYLKDKSPRLIDFIVGFQLVDRNEDNTKAIGVFGFKVGDQWLYAPVFFLNGDLKGHELLYIKKQDAFVPMKENWVNYLISRKPHVLGEGSDQSTHQLGGMQPNLQRLGRPPGTKYGSDAEAPVFLASWVHPAMPLFCALGTKKAAALYEKVGGDLNFDAVIAEPFTAALAPSAAKFDLRNALSDFPFLKVAFEKAYTKYPLIKKGFDKFYGRDFFSEMAEVQRANVDSLVKRAESYIVPPEGYAPGKKPRRKYQGPSIIKPAQKEKKALWVYAADMEVSEDAPGGISENKPELTDAEREKLLKDTILIKDERDSSKTSIAYNTQVRTELTNPTETGLFSVLEKAGKFAEIVVVNNPHTGRGRENFCLVLRKDSPKNWKNTHRANLWVNQASDGGPTREDWVKYVEGLGGVESLEKGGTYVAVHENGSGTCPFRVKESYGDGAYDVSWEDSCYESKPGYALVGSNRSSDWEVGYSSWKARVYINKRKGTGLKSVNGELSIPDSYKIIKVSDPPKPKKEKGDDIVSMCCSSFGESDGSQSADEPIAPGNLIDLQLLLTKQASEIKLHDTGSQIVVKSRVGSEMMTKKAALISLVTRHGLREESARAMLKEAAAQQVFNRSARFLIKYAQGYGMQPGPSAPAFPEPEMGMEQLMGGGGVQAQYPQEEYMPVEGMQSGDTDPSTYDPFYQPDQNAMQVAQQAAQSGQKEVFDTAMIGGMLKAVRQDSLVDRYLGDLMKALDKLGRILFMFYWHQEEFEDRYGKQDLPELEDSLRNAFEVMGDVVLFLKEKTVGGGPGALNSTGLGASDAGEPNIQEAARN
jgi:hypothetical protein